MRMKMNSTAKGLGFFCYGVSYLDLFRVIQMMIHHIIQKNYLIMKMTNFHHLILVFHFLYQYFFIPIWFTHLVCQLWEIVVFIKELLYYKMQTNLVNLADESSFNLNQLIQFMLIQWSVIYIILMILPSFYILLIHFIIFKLLLIGEKIDFWYQ